MERDELRALLEKRRGRAIRAILGCKERAVDPLLPDTGAAEVASEELRRVVLEELNDMVEVALGYVHAQQPVVVVNEHYLRLLAEVHAAVVESETEHVPAAG
jgi:hypothetical protein